jgi:hypothetical protein
LGGNRARLAASGGGGPRRHDGCRIKDAGGASPALNRYEKGILRMHSGVERDFSGDIPLPGELI